MSREITIRYTDELIRLAGRRFLWTYIRRDFWLAVVMAGFSIGTSFFLKLEWKVLFGLPFLALALILIVLGSGLRNTRISLAKFRALKDPTSLWRFSPEFVLVKTDLGSSEFRWEVVTEIWRYPEFWLLQFGWAGYSVLPVAAIPEELQEFILAQHQLHGGKVR